MRHLYRHVLTVLSSSVLPYIAAFVYVAFAAVEFFFVNQFFTTGTTDLRTFFTAFPQASVLVLPVLCASLPYRPRDLSYPISSFGIVCAHFLALLTACALMLVLSLSVPAAVSRFGDIEASQLVCAYLILILYTGCALSACVFFGTLIPHQGAAFLASAVLLFAASFSHLVPLYVSIPAFLQSFFRSVSFAWHFDAASKGILDSGDIVFFVAVTLSFLASSAWVMERRRGNRSPFLRKLSFLAAAALVLVLADSSLLSLRIDTTANRQFTVSRYSRTVIAEVTEPLSISYYRSRTLKDLYPQIGDVEDFLRAYADQSPLVSFELLDPAKDSNAELLNRHGIYGQTIDTSGRESTSYATVYSAVVISYLGKTEVLSFVLDTSVLEYDLTSRVQQMVRGTARTVQIVTGNGLSLSDDYAYVVPWLQSQGFTVVQTALPSQAQNPSLAPFGELRSVPLLVLGSSRFTADDARALEDFIASGGKAFVAMTPYDVAIGQEGDWSVTGGENAVDLMLMDFGIFFYNSLTADISNFRLTLTSTQSADGTPTTERTEYLNYPLWPVLFPQTAAPSGMTLFWPCAMTLDEESALSAYKSSLEPLLVTSSRAWQIKASGGQFETNPFAVPQSPEDTTPYGTYTVACHALMQSQGGGELYVLGDQYALTVDMLSYGSAASADFRAYDFLTDTLLRLNGQGEILALKNRSLRNTSLYKMELSERLSRRTGTVSAVLCSVAAVLAALFTACAVRRRKFNMKG